MSSAHFETELPKAAGDLARGVDGDPVAGLRSMTGQGIATGDSGNRRISVELRTVNHRGLKFVFRTSDGASAIEPRIEQFLKSSLHRGSVQATVRMTSADGGGMAIDQTVLQRYLSELQTAQVETGAEIRIDLATVATLPGVMTNERSTEDPDKLWSLVEPVLRMAAIDLDRMRTIEGRSMVQTLVEECRIIRGRVERVAELAPRAAVKYAERLDAKIARIFAERDIELQPIDLIREVQVYADRADISEEVTRLGSHLAMFGQVIQTDGEAVGRKLDFIIQEMFRETNTIGSKAADTDISAEVVEIKCALERMRELIQNLE